MTEPKKSTKRIDAKKAAQNYYKRGMTLSESLVDAGASEAQGRKGKALLTERVHLMKAFKAEHAKQIKKLQLLGEAMSNEQLESFTMGTLVDVAASVKSKGSERVAAASWLGKTRKLNLFTPDQAIGLYNLQIPVDWQDRYVSTPTIEGELVQDAVASEPLSDLPEQDGMITLSSFEPRKLESGKIEIPKHMPVTEPEPIPVAVEQPTTNLSEDDYETF